MCQSQLVKNISYGTPDAFRLSAVKHPSRHAPSALLRTPHRPEDAAMLTVPQHSSLLQHVRLLAHPLHAYAALPHCGCRLITAVLRTKTILSYPIAVSSSAMTLRHGMQVNLELHLILTIPSTKQPDLQWNVSAVMIHDALMFISPSLNLKVSSEHTMKQMPTLGSASIALCSSQLVNLQGTLPCCQAQAPDCLHNKTLKYPLVPPLSTCSRLLQS